jgi:hypothetical protein
VDCIMPGCRAPRMRGTRLCRGHLEEYGKVSEWPAWLRDLARQDECDCDRERRRRERGISFVALDEECDGEHHPPCTPALRCRPGCCGDLPAAPYGDDALDAAYRRANGVE